jgi:hypothetical protein
MIKVVSQLVRLDEALARNIPPPSLFKLHTAKAQTNKNQSYSFKADFFSCYVALH